MSRLLGRLLVLLALWSQILAPMLAARAVLTVGDSLAGMTICGHSLADLGLPDAAGDPAGGDRHPAAASTCDLCCTGIAVLDAPPPTTASIALAWAVLVFLAPPDGPPASVHVRVSRARDPPTLA